MFRGYNPNGNLSGLTVGSGTNGLTTATIPVQASYLTVAVENTGANALSALSLLGKVTPTDLAYQTLASGTNWATTNSLIVGCSSGLASQGSNSAGWAMVRVAGFSQLQFTATTASGTTSVNLNPAFSDT